MCVLFVYVGTYYTFISVSIWGEGTTGGLCGWGGSACVHVHAGTCVFTVYVSLCMDDLP